MSRLLEEQDAGFKKAVSSMPAFDRLFIYNFEQRWMQEYMAAVCPKSVHVELMSKPETWPGSLSEHARAGASLVKYDKL